MEQNTEKFSILNSHILFPRSHRPAKRAVRRPIRPIYGLERQDQRDLTEGYREPISASRASLAGYHRYAAFQAGFLGDGSGYGRRFSRHPLGDLIP